MQLCGVTVTHVSRGHFPPANRAQVTDCPGLLGTSVKRPVGAGGGRREPCIADIGERRIAQALAPERITACVVSIGIPLLEAPNALEPATCNPQPATRNSQLSTPSKPLRRTITTFLTPSGCLRSQSGTLSCRGGEGAGPCIERLVVEGITGGCGTGTCPDNPVTRGQMRCS